MPIHDLFEETHRAKHDNNDDLKNEAEKRKNQSDNGQVPSGLLGRTPLDL
jgi:hypothetical protein